MSPGTPTPRDAIHTRHAITPPLVAFAFPFPMHAVPYVTLSSLPVSHAVTQISLRCRCASRAGRGWTLCSLTSLVTIHTERSLRLDSSQMAVHGYEDHESWLLLKRRR